MSRHPHIGVSVSTRTGWRVFPFFRWGLHRAGAVAVRIETGRARGNLKGLDGLIIGGGDDVGIELYGGELMPHSRFDVARDRLELGLIEEAENLRLPILGVCRGAQLINVARGGTLHEDIYDSYPGARRLNTPLPRKLVRIAPGSRLAHILGAEPSRVNALHRQSVDRLGAGLAPVAWDEAGVVQAIEGEEGPRLVIGVQWHPEYLLLSRRDARLFRALAEHA
ncbi:gamma-glutamyl-gamma-aminobutyrate hydrolase family protein [Limibaculum sp. FT325]|uniref:gamma-glutamyl-gamma-aminobutyrate hydrolase family protein n=1 Tax=Thermohalobaculum sediminis TaxID=2939436 RepID=UPI00201C3F76|nr:gamma-glutamyl-gamma-aminobutyrate hydrolase family protein [Limibaculum sediminis]MCL5775887.1 gamma-glutamyl-gamma-aminobutyrate hydrolase family protein [Limibaculum sediminis]